MGSIIHNCCCCYYCYYTNYCCCFCCFCVSDRFVVCIVFWFWVLSQKKNNFFFRYLRERNKWQFKCSAIWINIDTNSVSIYHANSVRPSVCLPVYCVYMPATCERARVNFDYVWCDPQSATVQCKNWRKEEKNNKISSTRWLAVLCPLCVWKTLEIFKLHTFDCKQMHINSNTTTISC